VIEKKSFTARVKRFQEWNPALTSNFNQLGWAITRFNEVYDLKKLRSKL